VSNILDDLRGLAGDKGNAFVVRQGERIVNVSVGTDSDDDVTGLTLWVGYDSSAQPGRVGEAGYRNDGAPLVGPRPLEITLRAETVADIVAKDQGVIVEWQSGDPSFDREIFVDSPVGDPKILGSVIGSDVRTGVLELFSLGAESVVLDSPSGGHVLVYFPHGRLVARDDGAGARVLSAFDRVLAHLPAVKASGEKRPVSRVGVAVNLFLLVIGGIGWLLNVGYAGGLAFLAQAIRGREIDVSPLAVLGTVAFGVVAGLLFARLYSSIVRRSARGTSNAHTRARWAGLIGFAGFSVIAFSVSFVCTLVVSG